MEGALFLSWSWTNSIIVYQIKNKLRELARVISVSRLHELVNKWVYHSCEIKEGISLQIIMTSNLFVSAIRFSCDRKASILTLVTGT